MIESEPKRRRKSEGRRSKRTPEVVAKIAEAIAIGLADEDGPVAVDGA
jgi:hypothetical protein